MRVRRTGLTAEQRMELLRQKGLGNSEEAIARSLEISPEMVSAVLSRARLAGLNLEQLNLLSDAQLEEKLYGN